VTSSPVNGRGKNLFPSPAGGRGVRGEGDKNIREPDD